MLRILLLIVAVMFHASIVNAETQEIVGVGEYHMIDENETLDHAKAQATLRAKRHISEQVMLSIESRSEVIEAGLNDDEIIVITAGVIYVTDTKTIIEDVDGLIVVTSEVTAEVDLDKIAELLEIEIRRRGEQ